MIPFTIHEFRLYAPVVVNGAATYALLDTGATRCSISPIYAKGLPVARTGMSHGALSSRQSNKVRLESLNFLDSTQNDLEVSVDIPEAFESMPFEVGATLDAATLLSKPLALSFKEQQVGFVTSPLREDLVCVPLELFRSLPFITCMLDGKPLHTIFDTGAGYSVINEARQAESAPHARHVYNLHEVGDVNGVAQTISVWESGPFGVGGISLGTCTFLAMDLSALETKLQTQIDFILGINTLLTSNLVLVVDAPTRRFCIAPHGTLVTQP